MSGVESLGAAALGPGVKFAIEEPYKSIKGIVASSKNLEYIYDLLSQDLRRLLAIEEDNESQVQKHKHKDTSMVYRSWKNRVSNIVAEEDKLRSKYERERLPKWRLFRRSSLGEKMVKRHNQVKDLIEEGLSLNILVDYKHLEPVLKVLDTPNIMEYPTLQSVLQEILGCLKNGKMKAIGVCGMKGVGKTTIMQNLNNSEEVSKLFDVVIFITVLGDHSDHKLQQAIAIRLKVDSECITDCTDEVARRIYEELKDKKYLLILDGVIDFINLTRLGIPNNDNGKVVMASQFLHVCNKNNVDRLIEVERLQHDEAWKMFQYIVSRVIERPGISPIARRVCNRCSRLPLLIHKIGNSFKVKNDAPSWRAALEDLDDKWREHQNEGLEELYSFLTFCYDQLQDKHQKCFLYTSLYPAESKIYTDYLVECWAAQGFLGDVNETRKYQKARDSGRLIIWDLINVSFLEKGETMTNIILNGCMRQLALYILSKHPHYKSYVHTTNEEFEEPQELKTWSKATWVSIIDSALCDLPISEDCHMLETLLLQKNSKLVTIPQTFFENMSNLLVLDLYGTAIRELPSSLSRLTGLKGLYVNACKHLNELPPEIESLQLLEVLDIRGSQVSFIPSYIGSLANLRCLRIPYIKNSNRSDHQSVEAANYKLISKLHNLEELIIEVISYEEWRNQAEKVMEQLALLRRLTTLRCSFPSSKILTIFAARREQWRDHKQFTSFQIFIGWPNSEHPQILHYFEDGVAMGEVIHETDAFKLICYKDITKLSDLEIERLNQVRGFLKEEGKKISTIVEGDKNSLIKWEQLAIFGATVFKKSAEVGICF